MNITDQQINALITCEKHVSEPPKQEFSLQFGSRKNDFKAISNNGDLFSVFIRQNTTFSENFSIGLIWYSKVVPKGTITLLRCNGAHGGNESIEHRFTNHIHTIDSNLIAAGIYEPKNVVETENYTTFDEALSYFLRLCNIADMEKYSICFSTPLFN